MPAHEFWGMEIDEYFDVVDQLAMQLLEARSPAARAKVDLVSLRLCDGCGKFHLRAKLAAPDATAAGGVGIEMIDENLRRLFDGAIETLLGETAEASGFDGRAIFDISGAVAQLLTGAGVNVQTDVDRIGVKRNRISGLVTLQAIFKDGREFSGAGDDVPKALAALSVQLSGKVLQ